MHNRNLFREFKIEMVHIFALCVQLVCHESQMSKKPGSVIFGCETTFSKYTSIDL